MFSKLNDDLKMEICHYLNDVDAIQVRLTDKHAEQALQRRHSFIKNRYHAWIDYMCPVMRRNPLASTLLLGKYDQLVMMIRSGLFRKQMDSVHVLGELYKENANLLTYCASYFLFETYAMVYDLYEMEGVEPYVDLEFVEKRKNTIEKMRIRAHVLSKSR